MKASLSWGLFSRLVLVRPTQGDADVEDPRAPDHPVAPWNCEEERMSLRKFKDPGTLKASGFGLYIC